MALGPDFILILPVGLLEELRAAQYKPQLAALLSKEMIEELIQILPGMLVASITTDPDQQVDTVRDWKDRYLIEAAVYNDVDILVTGDKDLLVLRDLLERPRILTPADFVGEFGASS